MYAGKIVTPYFTKERVSILVKDGIITDIVDGYITGSSILDYREHIVIPGILDTHIHGISGYDVNNARIEDILGMARQLVKHGVTGFLPSTVTAPHEVLLKISDIIPKAINEWNSVKEPPGARILGLHLEGPYINPEKRGAQNPKYIRAPEIREIMQYYNVSKRYLKMITLAPEITNGLDIISMLVRLGITVSLGHSNADYETARKAIEKGASRATHLFNAMRKIHHRDPGLIIALLENENVYVELITDFIHLHPAIIRFVTSHVGTKRIILISDSISATDLPDGEYSLGGLEVSVREGIAKLRDGTLAGSTLTLDRALKNMYSLGYSLNDIVRMLSLNPALSLGIRDLGDIRPGYKADFTVIDSELNVKATIVNGIEVFS